MKTLKTRIMSMFLVLVTMLTLLPTAAFAASSTGTGIKPTSNTNYWTTRLLHDGTPYSYKPPMAAGKMLYCMDRGYGYRWGTDSFLNSYTYTSATGTDADSVLKTALAESGLGELDAQQLENFKWMMTFIADYKGDIPGSLFMAAQTYVWDHQTFKGEGDGDIDAGGFANADTYETYCGYIDWMLAEKAKEDADFQKQIEEYAAQGIIATVVEDDSAKWAVWAKSSVRGRQSFFNYYAPRKLSVETAGEDTPTPPAGDADITLKKVVAGTTKGLDGAKFNIYLDGQIVGSDVTQNGGILEVNDVTEGLWSFVEVEAPSGYCADPTPISVYVRTTDGDKQYTVTAENYELPSMTIYKTDAQTGASIPSTVFSIKSVTGSYSTSVTTDKNGSATLDELPAGVYVVKEESVPEPYIVSNTEQTVALRPGKTSEVRFQDYQKPGLEILKKNIADGTPIEGVTYKVEQIDGSYSTSATTDNAGRIFLESIPVGSYEITEVNVPSNVILSEVPQTVALEAGCTRTVTFFNAMKPSLTILKQNSVTGDALAGAKFHIYYGSDNTTTGEINDLGVFTTDENGKIILTDIERGWYKLVEEVAPSGFGSKGDGVTEFYLEANTSKTVPVDNVPLSALVVYKYDAKTGAALEGCRFELRYLSGNTSGTGGTVIGTYTTGPNGAFTVTNLKKGTYICQEIASDGDHIIDREPQTVWISGEDQDVVTLRFGNVPLGSLLITKLSDDSKHEPLSGVEFLLTGSDGNFIGNNNGKFTTNSAGEILVEGLTPGMTVIARETRAKTGYLLDGTPQHALIKSGETVSLEFLNQPAGTLIIQKNSSGPNKEPLEGVQFKITYADGSYVDAEGGQLSSNGLYWTDENGQIKISGITGTLVVTEVQTINGYTIDENTRTQTVVVNPNDTQNLYFYNTPVGGMEIIKVNADKTSQRIPNVTFEIRKVNDELIDAVTTDKNGRVFCALPDGAYYAVEIEAADGFRLDDTPHYFEVKNGKTTTLTIKNKALSGILIHKIDSTTGDGIYGVTFLLYDGNKNPIGQYESDQDGYVYITGLEKSGRYYLRELENEGYHVDKQLKTVYVTAGKTIEIEWENEPITGQIQIYKYAAEYNEVTGTAPGTPLQGAVYEIVNTRSGKVVDYITTDARGVAASKALPLTRYQIREVTAPAYWQVSSEIFDVTLEYAGQIIKLSAYDRPSSLGVTITKRGNSEVMAGSQMRYDFTVANTSNVPLESFYWHDRIPTDIANATVLSTGTYSARLTYRILYKTNYSASYQVLASNLLTSNNYSFALNAIPMQAGEVVTDIYFDFGTVPVGFQSVANPTLSVMVKGTAVNGYQMVNRADVGGKYQGTWQTAQANWITIIRKIGNTPTLPKTGY